MTIGFLIELKQTSKHGVRNYKIATRRYKIASSRYKTDASRYKTGPRRYKADAQRYKIASLRYKVDALRYKVDALRYKADVLNTKLPFKGAIFLSEEQYTFASHICLSKPIEYNEAGYFSGPFNYCILRTIAFCLSSSAFSLFPFFLFYGIKLTFP